MLRHFSRNFFFSFFFQIFRLGIYLFVNFDQKMPKKLLFGKKSLFKYIFGQNFQKYCLIQKFEKQIPRASNFNIFNSKLFV